MSIPLSLPSPWKYFREMFYWGLFLKPVEKVQFWLMCIYIYIYIYGLGAKQEKKKGKTQKNMEREYTARNGMEEPTIRGLGE